MAPKRPGRGNGRRLDNGLTELVAGVRSHALLTGGSYLSGYAGVQFANNYSLITINRIILTYLYTSNGLFQTAVQLPIQDALSKRIEIESSELDNDDIQQVLDYWETNGWWETVKNFYTWVRLYGGGALLINTNQDEKKPMNWKTLDRGPLELYDIDRWQIDTSAAYFDDFETIFSSYTETEYFFLWGTPIHKSRFLLGRGKRAPSYVRRQLRGWGMSEAERMLRDLNLYLKTDDVLYEILDESKVDVYHIENLASKMLTTGGTEAITRRVQAANELKNYLHALVLDTKETFEQKTMTFSGLAEVKRENRIGIAAALRMPVNKLFGLSASGFGSGEDDLESYNQMIDSEIRAPLMPTIRELMKIAFLRVHGYIPSFSLKWPAMRVLTEQEEQEVKTAKQTRILELYDRGLLLSNEVGEALRKENVLTLETQMEKGLLAPQPIAPNGPSTVAPAGNGFKLNWKRKGPKIDVNPKR
jgi:phage-related protein (TIGR01555 family)